MYPGYAGNFLWTHLQLRVESASWAVPMLHSFVEPAAANKLPHKGHMPVEPKQRAKMKIASDIKGSAENP